MPADSIIDEIHRWRQEHAQALNHGIGAMFAEAGAAAHA